MDTETTSARVARTVREAMVKQGVSQLALSEATGIPRVTLIRRLRGQSAFDVTELDLIAEHLGLTISDLVAA